MDPFASMQEQLGIAKRAIQRADNEAEVDSELLQLSFLLIELHEWRMKGGFDPYQQAMAYTQLTGHQWYDVDG